MKKLIIILAAAAMTGCGIYKPYTRPEVKTDGLYGTAETADTTTIGNMGWEEMFTDPYLRTLIRQGLEKLRFHGAGEQYRPAIGAMEDQGSRGDA